MLQDSYPFKICDPIHGFIRYGELEKKVINSRPFQRLRYIRQMGVAYLFYPGANHTRFEHSLGVMELSSRIYNTMISPYNFPSNLSKTAEELNYWRRILRVAALCHDMGHLPFSHTAEKSLLPDGGHEKKTFEIICSPEMEAIWKEEKVSKEDILKLTISERELHEFQPHLKLDPWEKVLSMVITDDNFGADRIDYLIRDATYTGVGYGHFDYHQLIDMLRIVEDLKHIGVSLGGVQSVESLWIARYMMYARVYHHPKARVFTQHMHRFMKDYYEKRGFPCYLKDYLEETDYTILSALTEACKQGNRDALALFRQGEEFREVKFDERLEKQVLSLENDLKKTFGPDLFMDYDSKECKKREFVVLEGDRVISSNEASKFLSNIPLGGKNLCLFAPVDKVKLVNEWIEARASLEFAN